MKKKIACLFLAFVMIFALSASAFAAQGDFEFQYAGGTYTFNFNYFELPSDVYNKNAAIGCLALINNKQNGALFNSAGFTSFTADSFSLANSNDGIYYSLASKNIGDTTVIAITIEGTVGIQWYGNIDVGTGTDHAGFCKARDTILSDLENNFIPSVNAGSTLKFLVTGHSRGASTANLIAARLNKIGTFASRSVDKGDVYAYTFATANTTTSAQAHSEDYDNIFNIANRDDFVTVVPPASIGYTVYGQTLTLPSNTFNFGYPSLFSSMNTVYKKMTGKDFTMIKGGAVYPLVMTQDVAELSDGTVEGYYNNKYTVGAQQYSCYDLMVKYADYRSNDKTLVDGAVSFFNSAKGSQFGEIINYAYNGGNMWSSHYPAVYTSWLASLSQENLFSKKTFNTVTLDTQAKIKVYDSNEKLVGIVENGKINEYMTNSVTILDTDEGYRLYLPGDASYYVTLVGDTQSNYTYTVEKCTDTGIVTDSGSTTGTVGAGEILKAEIFETASNHQKADYAFSKVDSTPDDEPKPPTGGSSVSFLDKIRSFFQRIIDWFKALFK